MRSWAQLGQDLPPSNPGVCDYPSRPLTSQWDPHCLAKGTPGRDGLGGAWKVEVSFPLGKWQYLRVGYRGRTEPGNMDGGPPGLPEFSAGVRRRQWVEEESSFCCLWSPRPFCQVRRHPISLGPVGWTCFLCPCVHPDHLFLLFYTSNSQQNYFCQNLCYDSRGRGVFWDAFEILLNNLWVMMEHFNKNPVLVVVCILG